MRRAKTSQDKEGWQTGYPITDTQEQRVAGEWRGESVNNKPDYEEHFREEAYALKRNFLHDGMLLCAPMEFEKNARRVHVAILSLFIYYLLYCSLQLFVHLYEKYLCDEMQDVL